MKNKELLIKTQDVCERLYEHTKSKGNVYMLHQVTDEKERWVDASCAMTCGGFSDFIAALKQKNCAFLPLTQLKSRLEQNRSTAKDAYITFDDAYDDVYDCCYPILKENNIPFTCFMATSFLDTKGYLTTQMLKEMTESGLCTVGAHTVHHQLLRFESDETVFSEIETSKRELSEIFGVPIELFAFPFGSIYACSKKNRKAAKKAGFELGFSTINTHLSPLSCRDRIYIPRRNVNEENCRTITGKP